MPRKYQEKKKGMRFASFVAPPGLLRTLEAQARKENVSRSAIIVRLLTEATAKRRVATTNG